MPNKKNWKGTVGQRFWQSIDRSKGYASCWEWKGAKNKDGYGQIQVNGRLIGAHRAAYELYRKPVPAGMYVLHVCDNRACANPSHLFLGTHADNMADKVNKGRHVAPKGEAHGCAKLNARDVGDIKKRLQAGESNKSIAAIYGVSGAAVSKIKTGRKWRHVEAAA